MVYLKAHSNCDLSAFRTFLWSICFLQYWTLEKGCDPGGLWVL